MIIVEIPYIVFTDHVFDVLKDECLFVVSDPDLDGMNMWPAITNNQVSPREEMVYNVVDKKDDVHGAIR